MKFFINEHTTVENIQEAFTNHYPFLRIVFYAQEISRNYHVQKKLLTGNGLLLPESEQDHHLVDIGESRTVAEVEADFAAIGLQAQILRKCGTVWIETLLTRDWALELQNHEGEMLSSSISTYSAKKS